MKKKCLIWLACAVAIGLFGGCAGQAQGSAPGTTVVFGDAGWDSMKFHNAVCMFIGETAYGLKTAEMSGSTAVTYNALKTGDIHLYTETWTDNIPTYQEDVDAGRLIELGVNYDDNIQGIYLPRYVVEGDAERGIEPLAPGLRTVEDLKEYADLFPDPDDTSKGRLYGAISGWEVDEIIRKKVAFYGLDEHYNYMDPGSDAALSAAIAGAYERGEPIAAYYWEPAWITGRYDLVLLEDAPYQEDWYREGRCEFPSIRLTVCVNPALSEEYPEFCEFLSSYSTSSQLTSDALGYMHENDADYADAAIWFMTENDQLLDRWLPAEQANLVRAALAA